MKTTSLGDGVFGGPITYASRVRSITRCVDDFIADQGLTGVRLVMHEWNGKRGGRTRFVLYARGGASLEMSAIAARVLIKRGIKFTTRKGV